MAKITTKALEALKPADHGKRLSDGDRMFGIVRAVKNDPQAVSVDFEWRYNSSHYTQVPPVNLST